MELAVLGILIALFMLQYLPTWLKGPLFLVALTVHSLFWFIPFLILALTKILIPNETFQKWITQGLTYLTENWIATNLLIMRLTQQTQWDIDIQGQLNRRQNYFVLCNHQSWVDIFVLHKVLYKRVPFMKFFTKRELIWFPICGFVWWMLDFPFMYRYSKEERLKNPEKNGIDIETTKKFCQKMGKIPTALLSFLEGTRFTKEKHEHQQSPFKHLLKPKAGGLANTLEIMGQKLDGLINVTLVYPDGSPSFFEFLSGKVKRIMVKIEQLEIPAEFLNANYMQNEQHRSRFQQWLNQLWLEKDKTIDELLVKSQND